jgi:signal transduction histidine kinase
VRLPDLLRTSAFRHSVLFALGSALSSSILFAFIYWQTAVYERQRISSLLVEEVAVVAAEPEEQLRRAVASRLESDIHRVAFAGLFSPEGQRIAGNLEAIPADLDVDRTVRAVGIERTDGPLHKRILAIAVQVQNGDVLVIGRDIDELRNLRSLVTRALLLGVVPAFFIALLAGVVLSRRMREKIVAANETVDRVMQGNLHERLPVSSNADDFDHLAAGVNRMLDEIERMVDQIKGAVESIAHDLRTPLIQMHTRLERSRTRGQQSKEMDEIVDRALVDLETTLGIITALLRIAEIEDGRRRTAFALVDMTSVARTVFDLYEPIAEEKELRFGFEPGRVTPVLGDQELLTELLTNLVDNAVKFTPIGGHVDITIVQEADDRVTVRVSDTGPGIDEEERAQVFQRFYRANQTRHIQGHGLGLSLVQAVARLHGFEVNIGNGDPGTVFELTCRVAHGQSAA